MGQQMLNNASISKWEVLPRTRGSGGRKTSQQNEEVPSTESQVAHK